MDRTAWDRRGDGDCGVYEDGFRRSAGGRWTKRRGCRNTSGFVGSGSTADRGGHCRGRRRVRAAVARGGRRGDGIRAPKLEAYEGVVLVVLKPVRYVVHEEVVDVSEIALFLGPNLWSPFGTATVTCRGGPAELDPGESHLLGPAPRRCSTARPTWWWTATRTPSSPSTRTSTRSRARCSAVTIRTRRADLQAERETAEFCGVVLALATCWTGWPKSRLLVDKSAAPYFRALTTCVARGGRHRGRRGSSPTYCRRIRPGRRRTDGSRSGRTRTCAGSPPGRRRARADRDRRDLRDGLRGHARAHVEVRLLHGPWRHR